MFAYVVLSVICGGIYAYLFLLCCIFFFKQKTAYEMRISDWSSDVCSSDLKAPGSRADGGGVAGDPAAIARGTGAGFEPDQGTQIAGHRRLRQRRQQADRKSVV